MSFQYSAFVSYSHAEPDAAWAKWLQSAVETYKVPAAIRRQQGIAPRLPHVFRDTEELTAAPNLNDALKTALGAADKLLVVCTPSSRASAWVQQEVAEFLRVRGREHVILVLAEGEPGTAFPPMLLEDGGEPLAVDVRQSAGDSTRTRKRRARQVVLATMLGIGLDDLVRREAQRERRVFAAITGLVLAIAAAMAVLAILAVRQRQEAVAQSKAARRSERLALDRLAQSLLDQGQTSNAAGRYQEAFAAFAEARKLLEDIGQSSLRADLKLLELSPISPYRWLRGFVSAISVSSHADRLAVVLDSRLEVIDLVADQLVSVADLGRAGLTGAPSHIALSSDGATLAAASGPAIALFDASTGTYEKVGTFKGTEAIALHFGRDGKRLLVAAKDGAVHVWDVEADRVTKALEHDGELKDFAMSADDGVLAVLRKDGNLEICALVGDRCAGAVRLPADHVESVALTEDGGHLLTADGDAIRLWDWRARKVLRETATGARKLWVFGSLLAYADLAGSVHLSDLKRGTSFGSLVTQSMGEQQLAFSRSRIAFFTANEEGMLLWQLVMGAPPGLGANVLLDDELFLQVGLSKDGALLAAGDAHGQVGLFDTATGQPLARIQAHPARIAAVGFSPDDSTLLTLDEAGEFALWDVATGAVQSRRQGSWGKPTALEWNRASGVAAKGCASGEVHLLDPTTGADVAPAFQLGQPVHALSFDANGVTLAVSGAPPTAEESPAEESRLAVWTRAGGLQEVDRAVGPPLPTACVSADGKLLLAAGKSLTVIDMATKARRLLSSGPAAAAGFLGPDLAWLAAYRGLKIITVSDGRTVASLSRADTIWDAVAAPDGSALVVSRDEGLRTWVPGRVAERERLRTRLEAYRVAEPGADVGAHLALLARWYLANGFDKVAARYLRDHRTAQGDLTARELFEVRRAANQPAAAEASLAEAVRRKEVSKIWAALAQRALRAP